MSKEFYSMGSPSSAYTDKTMRRYVAYLRDELIQDYRDARCPVEAGEFTRCANIIDRLLDERNTNNLNK